MKRVLLGAVAGLLLVACGVSSEDSPQPITDTVSTDTGPTPSVDNSPDSSTPSLTPTTTTTTSTTTTPTHPRRTAPPHSTEPSPTR